MSRQAAEALRARAADAGDVWRLSLAELFDVVGRQSLPSVLLVSAALTLMPVAGAGTVLSFVLWWVAWAWWQGQSQVRLPERAMGLSLSPRWSRRCANGLAWVLEAGDRCLKPRWSLCVHQRVQRWWGVWVSLMAVLIFLPLPLGNVLPALSLMLLALGWMFRDGLALAVAGVTGVAALGYVVVWWEVVLRVLAATLAHLPWLQAT